MCLYKLIFSHHLSLVCLSRRASAGAAGAVPEEAAAVLYCL